MVTAIVLIKTEHNKINKVAETLAAISEFSEVYSVGGSYDIIGILRVKTNEAIADLVTEEMVGIDGIISTETLISFKTYSRYELEHLFSIGMESQNR